MRHTSQTHLVDNSHIDAADEDLSSSLLRAGVDTEQIAALTTGRTATDVRLACEHILWHDPTRAEQVLVVGRVSGMRSVIQVAIRKMETHSYYNNADGRIQLRDAEKALERERENSRQPKNGVRHNGNGKH